MKLTLRITLFCALISLISSCASTPPPSATKHGLLQTNSFDPLFLAATKGGAISVDFKAMTLMFEKDAPGMGFIKDTVVVSNQGIHLVEWNIERVHFDNKFLLKYEEIKSIRAVVLEVSILPNVETLVVATNDGRTYNFRIYGASSRQAAMLADARLTRTRSATSGR